MVDIAGVGGWTRILAFPGYFLDRNGSFTGHISCGEWIRRD